MQARQPSLVHRRYVGHQRQSQRRRDGIGLDLSLADLRHDGARLHYAEVDVPGDQILHDRGAAAIRHELEARAGELLKQQPRDVRRAADADGGQRRLAGAKLEPVDQLAHILGRHGGFGDDHQRVRRDQRNRLEVGQRVALQRVNGAGDHVGEPAAEAERIAVRRRARDPPHADAAAGAARHIFDHHRLTQRHAHAVGDDAADRIEGAAGRERNDDRDWPRRINLRRGGARGQQQSSEG
jgi:hypothetical protein